MNKDEIRDLIAEAHRRGDREIAVALMAKYDEAEVAGPSRGEANAEYALGLNSQIGQGITFGLSDELAGAVGALPAAASLGEFNPAGIARAYRGIRDDARQTANEFRDQRPGASIAANVGGALMTAIPTGGSSVATALSAAPARSGALLGAVGGYGASEADSAGKLAADTALGATVGGVVGRLAQPTANAIGEAVTTPGRYVAASRAGRPARAVLQAMERDGVTPAQVGARLQKMPAGAAMVDAGGKNLERLGENIITMPGSGSNIGQRLFEARRAGAPARVEGLINRALGTQGRNFHEVADALDDHLKTAAKPLYDAAYKKPVMQTPVLKGMTERLKQSGVYAAAQKKMRLDGQVTGTGIRFWDYAKREIDDRIGEAIRAGRNNDARIFTDLKNTMVREIDNQVPEYAQARAIYSGGARMRDALEAGRQFMREDAEVIAANLDDFSPGELQMFRLGAARQLRDKMLAKPDGGDVSKAWFNTPLMREKISALFNDRRQLATLFRGMRSEGKMQATANATAANSATARRLQGVRDVLTDPETQADFAVSGIKGGAINALRKWWTANASNLRNENVRTEIARIIFNGNAQERQILLQQIQKRPTMIPYSPAPAAPGVTPALSGGIGAAVSSQSNARR